MNVVATVLVALVALIHVYIVVLEMVLWTTPRGQAAFGLTPEFAQQTKALAGNQGLYNGFLAAGLVWGLVGPEHLRFGFQVFFLLCVDRRRALRRRHRQPPDPVRAGRPGRPRAGRRPDRPLTRPPCPDLTCWPPVVTRPLRRRSVTIWAHQWPDGAAPLDEPPQYSVYISSPVVILGM